MMTNATISISKTTSNGDAPAYIAIDVRDANGRKRLIRVEMSLETFAEALFGMAQVGCSAEVHREANQG